MVVLSCYGFERIEETYCIPYGNPTAPLKIREYYSFSCPKCLDLYQKEFTKIKSEYIDTGKVYWIFHPDPVDLSTLKAMDCLSRLDSKQKRLFFESLFEAMRPSTLHKAPKLMKKAMEYFKKPISKLEELKYLETTLAFQAAFEFLKQNPPIHAVPTIEIEGEIFEEMPTLAFIHEQIEKKLQEKR